MDEQSSGQFSSPTQSAPEQLSPFVQPEKKSSAMKKFLLFGGLVALLLLGAAFWWLFAGSGKSLGIDVILPERLQVGVPVEVSVALTNDSGSGLKDVQVSMSLPEGIIFVGTPGTRSVENHSIGIVEANKLTKEPFMIMAVGPENIVAELTASVSYVPGALSSRFEKTVTKEVPIGGPGIELSVAPPAKAFGGEQFDTEITYRNNSEVDFESVQIKLNYPAGYSFVSATTPAADTANTIWQLSSLKSGGEGKFSVKGFILGQDNANFDIQAVMSAAIGEGSYDIASQTASVSMAPSPLSIRIAIVEGPGPFSTNQSLTYRLMYSNNTSVGLRDVIIRAKLIGEMFDLKTLKTTGSLRSSDNTIIWNAARIPDFASLAPGASGSVDFNILTKAAYPITRLSSKNFTLGVRAEIESPTVPRNVAATKTLGVADLSAKMRGALSLSTLGYFRDPTSGIANAGSLPPAVGVPTQFTVHWVLRNTSTDVSNIRLRAFLGPNVRYTGQFRTNLASSSPEYNERTQEIVWQVPHMQATRGILSDPLRVVFQVELVPGADQIKSIPTLIQPTTADYSDDFTGEHLTSTASALTLSLPDDTASFNLAKSVRE